MGERHGDNMVADLMIEESKDADAGAVTTRYRNTRVSGGDQTMRMRPETKAIDDNDI